MEQIRYDGPEVGTRRANLRNQRLICVPLGSDLPSGGGGPAFLIRLVRGCKLQV